MYLLDTNTVSYFLKQHPKVVTEFQKCTENELSISSVTKAELLFGMVKNPYKTRINALVEDFLSHVSVLAWTGKTASHFATLKYEMQKQGLSLEDMDLMIASHAFEHSKVLVTSDKAFHKIPQLQVVDWSI